MRKYWSDVIKPRDNEINDQQDKNHQFVMNLENRVEHRDRRKGPVGRREEKSTRTLLKTAKMKEIVIWEFHWRRKALRQLRENGVMRSQHKRKKNLIDSERVWDMWDI